MSYGISSFFTRQPLTSIATGVASIGTLATGITGRFISVFTSKDVGACCIENVVHLAKWACGAFEKADRALKCDSYTSRQVGWEVASTFIIGSSYISTCILAFNLVSQVLEQVKASGQSMGAIGGKEKEFWTNRRVATMGAYILIAGMAFIMGAITNHHAEMNSAQYGTGCYKTNFDQEIWPLMQNVTNIAQRSSICTSLKAKMIAYLLANVVSDLSGPAIILAGGLNLRGQAMALLESSNSHEPL